MRKSLGLIVSILMASLAMPAAAAQDTGDACSNVIVPAIQQAGRDAIASAPVFGCAQGADGIWAMRTVATTQDDQFTGTLSGQGQRLQQLVDDMAMDPAFVGAVQFDRASSTVFAVGVGNVMDPVDLSSQAVGSAPNWLNNYVNIYTQAMQTYLTQTAGQVPDLIEYMQWFMARRDSTLSSMTSGMNPMVGTAFRSNWGYQQFPWFWQLGDQEAIGAYTGQAPSDSSSGPLPSVPTSPLTPNQTATQNVDGPPVFSPAQFMVGPGDDISVTVSLPSTTFSGGFDLIVTLPTGLELLAVPQCTPEMACETATLHTDVSEIQGGETSVHISGLLTDRLEPAGFALVVGVSKTTTDGDVLLVTADLGFSSRSAPTGAGGVSVLEVIVTQPAA